MPDMNAADRCGPRVLDLDRSRNLQQSLQDSSADAAETIIQSVIPDALAVADFSPPEPLPVAELFATPPRDSIVFAIARVDRSGRLHDRLVSDTAAWTPGTTIEVISTPRFIIFRPNRNGMFQVTSSQCITIPAAARHRFQIQAGDRVLLAALPDHGIVMAYPLSTLNEALAIFHLEQVRADDRS